MEHHKRLTHEERKELERLKDSDFSSNDIADYLQRSLSVVKQEYRRGGGRYKYTAEKGEEERLKRKEKQSTRRSLANLRPLDLETRKKIESLKDTNLSGHQIGEKVGRGGSVIHREFRLFGGREFYNAEKAAEMSERTKKAKYDSLRKIYEDDISKEIPLIQKDATNEFINRKKEIISDRSSMPLPDYIPKLPLKLWCERFVEECAQKRNNWRKERRYFEFWLTHFGDKIAVNISPLEIETVANEIIKKKNRLKKNGETLSVETRRKYLLMLSSLFTIAIKEWKWALFNPVSAVDTRTKEKSGYKVYSKDKIELHDQLKGDLIKLIKSYKEENRLTDKEFSDKCGISRSIYQRVIDMDHNITLKVVCRICAALGLKLSIGGA